VDSVRVDIIVEVGIIDIVEEGSVARVGVDIVSDKVDIVKERDSIVRV
jgi:hypothetical protein